MMVVVEGVESLQGVDVGVMVVVVVVGRMLLLQVSGRLFAQSMLLLQGVVVVAVMRGFWGAGRRGRPAAVRGAVVVGSVGGQGVAVGWRAEVAWALASWKKKGGRLEGLVG